MKKILVIYPGFPHYRKGVIEELITHGSHQYTFIGDQKGYNNIKPYIFKKEDSFIHFRSPQWGPVILSFGLLRYVISTKCDGAIVHAAPYSITITLASLILKIRGKKVYNWAHGVLSSAPTLRNKIYLYYYKLFFNGMLVYGKKAKQNLNSLGYEQEKVWVIYNSLDYKEQYQYRIQSNGVDVQQLRKDLFKYPELPQLLFIGRLTPQKKLEMLIEAHAELHATPHKTNLLFVGEGSMKSILMNKVREYGLEDFTTFYGASFDEATNHALITASDCCVAPGEVGLTAIHSLMYGTPVISHSDANHQMPEFEAIIHGKNGALFERGNSADLRDKIIQVLELSSDKGKLQMMKECYEIVDRVYNPRSQMQVIENLPW